MGSQRVVNARHWDSERSHCPSSAMVYDGLSIGSSREDCRERHGSSEGSLRRNMCKLCSAISYNYVCGGNYENDKCLLAEFNFLLLLLCICTGTPAVLLVRCPWSYRYGTYQYHAGRKNHRFVHKCRWTPAWFLAELWEIPNHRFPRQHRNGCQVDQSSRRDRRGIHRLRLSRCRLDHSIWNRNERRHSGTVHHLTFHLSRFPVEERHLYGD